MGEKAKGSRRVFEEEAGSKGSLQTLESGKQWRNWL